MRPPIDVPPSFSSGFAFRFTRGDMDDHRRVVLSDPLDEEQRVVVVNFTKWRPWKDQTCIVDPSECPGVLTLRSCVEYAACEVWKLGTLETRLGDGHQAFGNVGPDVLGKMRQGVIASQFAPYGAKEILLSQRLVSDS